MTAIKETAKEGRDTRTSTPIVALAVLCWRERARTDAFKALAEQTELVAGDRVEIWGNVQINSWTRQH